MSESPVLLRRLPASMTETIEECRILAVAKIDADAPGVSRTAAS